MKKHFRCGGETSRGLYPMCLGTGKGTQNVHSKFCGSYLFLDIAGRAPAPIREFMNKVLDSFAGSYSAFQKPMTLPTGNNIVSPSNPEPNVVGGSVTNSPIGERNRGPRDGNVRCNFGGEGPL